MKQTITPTNNKDQLHGLCIIYYSDGKIEYKGYFINDNGYGYFIDNNNGINRQIRFNLR